MTTQDELAKKAVDKMMELDYFSQWMGIEIIEVRQYYSKIKM